MHKSHETSVKMYLVFIVILALACASCQGVGGGISSIYDVRLEGPLSECYNMYGTQLSFLLVGLGGEGYSLDIQLLSDFNANTLTVEVLGFDLGTIIHYNANSKSNWWLIIKPMVGWWQSPDTTKSGSGMDGISFGFGYLHNKYDGWGKRPVFALELGWYRFHGFDDGADPHSVVISIKGYL